MLDFLLDLIYPKYLTCCLCQGPLSLTDKDPICHVCKSSLQYSSDPCCEICGKNLFGDNSYLICSSCKLLDLSFHRGAALWSYDDYIKPLIFKFKYKAHTYLYDWLAEQMIKKISRLNLPYEFDCIVSVPMHDKRKSKRGYDPVDGLCQAVSEKSGIPYIKAIKRKENTPQLHAFSAEERKIILSQAFVGINEVVGNVLLIDDIFTTGNTMNQCGKILMEIGADYIFTLALCVGDQNKQ